MSHRDLRRRHNSTEWPASPKVIRHAGRGVVGKSFIGGADQDLEIRIGGGAEKRARAGADVMPFDVVEPAVLVRT